MYYETQVRDGVLCFRTEPDGKWVKYTKKQLTEVIIEQKKELDRISTAWARDAELLNKIAFIAKHQGQIYKGE